MKRYFMKAIFVRHVIIYNIRGSTTQLAAQAFDNDVGDYSLQVVGPD